MFIFNFVVPLKDEAFSVTTKNDLEIKMSRLTDDETGFYQQMKKMLNDPSKKEIIFAIYMLYDIYSQAIESHDLQQFYTINPVRKRLSRGWGIFGGMDYLNLFNSRGSRSELPQLSELKKSFSTIVTYFYEIQPYKCIPLLCESLEEDSYQSATKILEAFIFHDRLLNGLYVHILALEDNQRTAASTKISFFCLIIACLLIFLSCMFETIKMARVIPLFSPVLGWLFLGYLDVKHYNQRDNILHAFGVLRSSVHHYFLAGDNTSGPLRMLGGSNAHLLYFTNNPAEKPNTLYELIHQAFVVSEYDFIDKIRFSLLKPLIEKFIQEHEERIKGEEFPVDEFIDMKIATIPLFSCIEWQEEDKLPVLDQPIRETAKRQVNRMVAEMGIFRFAYCQENLDTANTVCGLDIV